MQQICQIKHQGLFVDKCRGNTHTPSTLWTQEMEDSGGQMGSWGCIEGICVAAYQQAEEGG